MKNILIFIAGAAVGSFITWKLVKSSTETYIQEEIDSVKRVYSKMNKIKNDEIKKEAYEQAQNDIYETIVDHYTSSDGVAKKPTPSNKEKPYVITSYESGEVGYDVIELVYYADGVLADDHYEKIEDVDDVVGLDSLEKIGEFEDDCVYVRNDRLKADYEICLDHRTYQDVMESMPYLMEY